MDRTAALKRLSTLLLALALCTLAAAVSAAAAAARAGGSPPVTAHSTYLALGDSVTFGYMEPGVVPAPNYHNAASFPGYPEQMGRALNLKVVNLGCPGETSSSLINPTAVSNGCENTLGHPGGYRVSFPLHVHYTGAQLAYAVSYLRKHSHVRLVSLMIGANDLFACQSTTADKCTSASEENAVLSKLGKNVHHILAAIRHKGHYRGQVAILNYYSLDYTSSFITGIVNALNNAVDKAAKPFHVTIADGFGQFKAASLHSAGNPCTAGLLTQLGQPGKCGVHPSYAGQALLAQAVEDAVRF